MSKLIFGCGYLGERVAERWHASGEKVHVVTRSTEHASRFGHRGWLPILVDVTRPATLVNLPAADTVLYAVGFDRTAGRSIHEVYVDGLAHVLDALDDATKKIIYVSSTGVFGQDCGAWVDEQSPCHPERDAGRACLAAEQLLTAHRLGKRAVILRMSGLYGPGRIPRQRELRAGIPLAVPSSGYLNLIHVDDAASAVLAAEQQAPAPRLYLVSDGHPVPRHEYYKHLAERLGAPAPKFEPAPAENPAAARATADKRVKNERMLGELKIELAYPSFREGLDAILAAEAAAST